MALTNEQRQRVFRRAKHSCEYCKTPEKYSGLPLEIDHIIPQSVGGSDELDNLCAACRSCNKYKHHFLTGVDPETQNEAPLFNPRNERWQDHFQWSEDGIYIIGKSEVGRASVSRLQLNNEFVITACELWRKLGWTPPQD